MTRSVVRLGLLALVLAVPACAPKAAETGASRDEPAPVVVTVAPIAPVALKRTVSVVGTLDPYKDVTLAPEVDGMVRRAVHDVGDVVFPGDVLLVLDDEQYRYDLQSAQAALRVELARINLTELPQDGANLDTVGTVVRARATLKLAEKDFTRIKAEQKGGIAAAALYDRAEAEVDLARAAVRVAEAEATAVLEHARGLKSALDKAEKRLRDTRLLAPVPDNWSAWAATMGAFASPFRYTIAKRMVWEGEMVRAMPEKNAYRLVITHILKLRAAVPEKYSPDVRPGQPVEVRVDAYPSRQFLGTVVRVEPTVDTQNRTFQVEVAVPNTDLQTTLKPGSFAKAEILTRTDTAVITVPPGAIVAFAGVNKVYIAEGDRARAIEVRLGQRDRDWVEVIGAVPAGARIITSGLTQLVDGARIRIR